MRKVLQFYDPSKATKISTDASQDGLGAVLLQLHGEDWKPVSYASRALLDAEKRYAQIEKELLSISFGCNRFHQFIHGDTVEAETDHKPLESLFQKPLVDCPLRIQRMLLKLQKYDLDVHYVPGKHLVVADALSRAVDASYRSNTDERAAEAMTVEIQEVMKVIPVTEEQKRRILKETEKDSVMKELTLVILNGWPASKESCAHQIRRYWNIQNELSIADGLIFKGTRLLVPQGLRHEMMQKIHERHMGITKSQQRARESVYWPGISQDVRDLIERSSTCL